MGGGEFIERILKETNESIKHYIPTHEKIKKAKRYIEDQCKKEKISTKELMSGSLCSYIVQIGKKITNYPVKQIGISLAEAAR